MARWTIRGVLRGTAQRDHLGLVDLAGHRSEPEDAAVKPQRPREQAGPVHLKAQQQAVCDDKELAVTKAAHQENADARRICWIPGEYGGYSWQIVGYHLPLEVGAWHDWGGRGQELLSEPDPRSPEHPVSRSTQEDDEDEDTDEDDEDEMDEVNDEDKTTTTHDSL